jgi:hypothetical protein
VRACVMEIEKRPYLIARVNGGNGSCVAVGPVVDEALSADVGSAGEGRQAQEKDAGGGGILPYIRHNLTHPAHPTGRFGASPGGGGFRV